MIAEISNALDKELEALGRSPQDVKRSVLLMVYCGHDEAELKARSRYLNDWAPETLDMPFDQQIAEVKQMVEGMENPASLTISFCPIIGTPEKVLEKLQAYSDAGIEEVIFQWFDVDDFEGIHKYAEYILPHV